MVRGDSEAYLHSNKTCDTSFTDSESEGSLQGSSCLGMIEDEICFKFRVEHAQVPSTRTVYLYMLLTRLHQLDSVMQVPRYLDLRVMCRAVGE